MWCCGLTSIHYDDYFTGMIDQYGGDYGAVGVAPPVTEQQATVMQMLQADRRRRLLEYQQRKRLERGKRLVIFGCSR